MEINTKDKRIAKLWNKGLSLAQIARKIGMPGNLDRVIEGLHREGLAEIVKVGDSGVVYHD